MKTVYMVTLVFALATQAMAVTMSECAGVVRGFGDASSWTTSCFVVGDGGWVVTTSDAVTEKISSSASQPVRTAIFISAYTGEACQCEIKARDADLNIALLKLTRVGLPAVQFAKSSEFSKTAYATLGQLMSGEQMGNSWSTEIYGITREKAGEGYRLAVGQWSADKAFLTDIGDFKWLFLGGMSARNMPAGSIVARGQVIVGMYINRLVLTGGGSDVAYGRCSTSEEIAKFIGKHGVTSATLYDPPAQTVRADETASKAFQLQSAIYTLIAAGRTGEAVGSAAELVKLRPQDAQAQAVYGIALTGAGKFEDAMKAFDKAEKLDPKLPTLRLNRALALVGLKKRTEAEVELTKAVEESPSDVRTVSALADFYLGDEKTYDKGLKYAMKAAQMALNSPAAMLLVARAQKRLKNYNAAIKSIESVMKLVPDWPPVQFALGITCEESGDKARAEKAYRRLVELRPNDPQALLMLASFLADNRKPADALEFITKLRELKPSKEFLDAAKVVEEKIKGLPPADQE